MIKKETCILTYINYMRIPQCHILLIKTIHWHNRECQSYIRNLLSANQKRFYRLNCRIRLIFFFLILCTAITLGMLNAQDFGIFKCENFVSNQCIQSNKLIYLKEFTNKFDIGQSWPQQSRDNRILLKNGIVGVGVGGFTESLLGRLPIKNAMKRDFWHVLDKLEAVEKRLVREFF